MFSMTTFSASARNCTVGRVSGFFGSANHVIRAIHFQLLSGSTTYSISMTFAVH
eukprot:NODE_13665_length_241_cov_1.526882.p2 GENE.NODE_13665_length_241_cov_1.526882~~NODE_13665_length_241_cov_1.526882.p2  ORF type:complete len:54 (+),score=7.37 NODE_13665_length_241_cov_1.526882:50-211(+)